MAHLRRRLASWAVKKLDFVVRPWSDQNSGKRNYNASHSISLIEQLKHPFRVRNFWDKLISNYGRHSNRSFSYTYYNGENVNLVYRKRTDFGAGCTQLLIPTSEPPGEHRYGSWNSNMVYRSLSLPIISLTNLQKTLTNKNNIDMFVKSDQEITDGQAVYRPWHLGWNISILAENMERWSLCTESLIILLRY